MLDPNDRDDGQDDATSDTDDYTGSEDLVYGLRESDVSDTEQR